MITTLRAIMVNLRANPPKRSWRRFSIQAALVAALIIFAASYMIDRFTIGFDTQAEPSIVGVRLIVIDTYDRLPVRGGTFAFRATNLAPYLSEGARVNKVMVGMPSDSVSIMDGVTSINGNVVATDLGLAKILKRDVSYYNRSFIIPSGRYWMMGTSSTSFDSRYWGTIGVEQIIGRSYSLL